MAARTRSTKTKPGSKPNLAPPWQPGASGNPGGRPKCRALTEPLRQLLERPIDPEHPLWPELTEDQQQRFAGRTPGEAVAVVAIAQAVAGDGTAREFVVLRAEGRLALAVQGDPDGPPIEHHHRHTHTLSPAGETLLAELLLP